MKSIQFTLAAAAFLALFLGGQAMAAETRQAGEGVGQSPDKSGEMIAPCRDQTNESAAVLPPEAPWISLAITNGEGIGLSTEQKNTLEKLRSEFQQLSTKKREAVATAEQELNQLLQADSVKLPLVSRQVERIGALHNDLRQNRIETLLKGRSVLDAGQQTKLQELVARSAGETHNAMMERYHGAHGDYGAHGAHGDYGDHGDHGNHGQAMPPQGMM